MERHIIRTIEKITYANRKVTKWTVAHDMNFNITNDRLELIQEVIDNLPTLVDRYRKARYEYLCELPKRTGTGGI